jgi:phospholipid/cholesterol/gamma-HCH transport system substrate-binding protein
MDAAQSGSSRTLLQLRVGIFILAGLVVFAGLVYLLGRQSGLFERQYRLHAGFSQIGGLIEGATVRLAGVPVGRVTAIRLPETGDRKVLVELTLVRRVQPRVRADSVARIDILGLLGDKIVEVSLGSSGAAVLADGAEIRTEDPLDTNRLTQQGTELLRNLITVSSDLHAAITKATTSPAGSDLQETLRAVRVLATEIERGQGLLHRLVYDRSLGNAVADAAGTIRQVGETVRRLDGLLADSRGGGLGQAAATLAEAREAAQRVNRILRQVEEGSGTLHALIYDESHLLRDLDRTLGRVDALVTAVDRGEGTVGMLLRDPDATQRVRKVILAAEGLADAVDRARESDSLLRTLLGDPALAADLRETARSFREVSGRLARGEGLLGSLTRPGTEALAKDVAEGLAGLGRAADQVAGDGRLGETLADLRVAMANIRVITARLEAGEGTVGGLLADPTVYENLAAFLEGAQRSVLLRALIRATAKPSPRAPNAGQSPGAPRP